MNSKQFSNQVLGLKRALGQTQVNLEIFDIGAVKNDGMVSF
jgi:hypothetical protein